MLTIEKTVTMSPEQYDIVIEGMRNPKNSWNRMDSGICKGGDNGIGCENCSDADCTHKFDHSYHIGNNDHRLMEQLASGGPVHAKYRRMMPVWVTINAPLYWWKEFDTYKVGTVCNSCSTMHKIQAKEFTIDDFSHEHLDYAVRAEVRSTVILEATIDILNYWRDKFLEYDRDLKICDLSPEARKMRTADLKHAWWQMIQLLPSSYNQKRTIMLNYEVLHNMEFWRHNHKLDEWHTFCDWVHSLPNSDLILVKENI